MWAALRESFAAEEFVPRPVEADPYGIPGKGSAWATERPRHLVSQEQGKSVLSRSRARRQLAVSRQNPGWDFWMTQVQPSRCRMPSIREAGRMPAIEIDARIRVFRSCGQRRRGRLTPSRRGAVGPLPWGWTVMRRLAVQAGGMKNQTPRDFVHRYTADGLTGPAGRPRPGRRPRLAEAQRCGRRSG
jgi:hypothetical protein